MGQAFARDSRLAELTYSLMAAPSGVGGSLQGFTIRNCGAVTLYLLFGVIPGFIIACWFASLLILSVILPISDAVLIGLRLLIFR